MKLKVHRITKAKLLQAKPQIMKKTFLLRTKSKTLQGVKVGENQSS